MFTLYEANPMFSSDFVLVGHLITFNRFSVSKR